MARWRVATYNIRHGLGRDGRVDLARTAREIAALEADVVALQEVDVAYGPRSGHEDQAARLGEWLGWQVAFGAALDLPPAADGQARRRYGLALLAPHALVDPVMHPLPSHPGVPARQEGRGVLQARVVRGEADGLDVLVTHLDNALPEHRTAEVLGLLRLSEDLPGPAVLLGDMNAAPEDPELAPLGAGGWREAARELRAARRAAPHQAGHGTGPAADGGAASHAALRRRGLDRLVRKVPALAGLARDPARPTHPARFPVRRIDSVWVRGDVTVRDLAVGGLVASDHRPVTATLDVTA